MWVLRQKNALSFRFFKPSSRNEYKKKDEGSSHNFLIDSLALHFQIFKLALTFVPVLYIGLSYRLGREWYPNFEYGVLL